MPFSVLPREPVAVLNHSSIADAQAPRRSYHPLWRRWNSSLEVGWPHALLEGVRFVEVQIVTFPETKVAAIEHWGQPSLEHDTVLKLVAWKLEQKLFDPAKYRSYSVHYTDPGQRRLQSTTSSSVFPSIARLAPTSGPKT